MVAVTGDYNLNLPKRRYSTGEVIEVDNKTYQVRDLGNSFIVYLIQLR